MLPGRRAGGQGDKGRPRHDKLRVTGPEVWNTVSIKLVPLACIGLLVVSGLVVPLAFRPVAGGGARLESTRLSEPFLLTPFSATALDGADVSSASWAGRVVVVNFWATWCAPCRREIPALADLQARYGDRVLVLGVLQDSVSDDLARQFAAGVRVNYPIVRATWEIERAFPAVAALPMTFLIDAERRVVAVHAGEIDPAIFEAQLVEALRAVRPVG